MANSSRCHRTRYSGKSSFGQAEVWENTFQGTGKILDGSLGIFKTARCGNEPMSGVRDSGLGRHKAFASCQHQSHKTQAECRVPPDINWRAAGFGESTDRVLAHGDNGGVRCHRTLLAVRANVRNVRAVASLYANFSKFLGKALRCYAKSKLASN